MDIERRSSTISDKDIARLVEAIKTTNHDCRFFDISHDDLYETVRLVKRMNNIFDESNRTIRKFIIKSMLIFIGVLLSGGLYKILKGIIIKDL